ncbi:hypothetical protein EKO04_002375 [Ascochyta lentis]|uniref:Uncharacterized protein n=1 Tax=Ascochyta lentis TaxID=205686 RepID=A0A8H7J7L5_9PLEO|nr:hypothetical protein EKO04_002375 [Ascochyta lentis]
MPYHHHAAFAQETPGAHERTERDIQDTSSSLAGPVGHRPLTVPSAHGQSTHYFHQQEQTRRRQHQYPHIQAAPIHQAHTKTTSHAPQRRQNEAVVNAASTFLPYCTAEISLNEEQVIAVTDIAGSLKELVLLTLGAKDGDEECKSRLESALGGEQAAAGVLDFFSDEFAIE